MALLTPVAPGANGTNADLLAALVAATGGGDSFYCTGREVFAVNNGGGGSITVTFSTAVSGANVPDNFGVINAVHDLTLTIAAGKIGTIWGVWPLRFRDVNGNVQVRYSGVTTVTVGVFVMAGYY